MPATQQASCLCGPSCRQPTRSHVQLPSLFPQVLASLDLSHTEHTATRKNLQRLSYMLTAFRFLLPQKLPQHTHVHQPHMHLSTRLQAEYTLVLTLCGLPAVLPAYYLARHCLTQVK